MKRLVIVFGLLLFTCPLYASLDSLGSYTNFIIKKEMWVCTSIAFPVDISYDAFNVDFKTIAQSRKGYFIQVRPGTHTDGSVFPDGDDIVQNPVKGVLNVAGKPAGVYEYIFVSTASDGFCGMSEGEQSVVRVYLVPQPTGFPVLTNVCPGTTEKIDFNKFLPPEIQYFIHETGWTVTYTTLDGKVVNMPVEAGLSSVGNNVYRYTFNDKDDSGQFRDKYSEMQSSAYFCPEDSAYLTHTVRIRDGEEYTVPNRSISFCTDVLQLVPETQNILNVNLFGYLGSSAPNGEWSVAYIGQLGGTNVEDDIITDGGDVSGDVKIPYALMAASTPPVDSIIFKYSYKDCSGKDTFTLLTLVFNDETFTNTFVEHERDVCRNLMAGEVELSSIFGFTAPLTSGLWYQKTTGDEFEEMLYGAVDISEMKSGSLYTFRYIVNGAVDAMCNVEGSSTLFHVRLHDLEVASAEAKICKQQFAAGITVDLSRYIPGLNDADRINPDKITWRDTIGNKIANPHSYRLQSTSPWQTSDTATYRMRYQYEVESDCGPYTGNLYISAVDSIGIDTARKVIICYTDDYARHVDLFQILGIVGANGNFDLFEAYNNNGAEIIPANIREIELSGIMNAFELFNTNNENETYVFRYQPGREKDCLPAEKMQITVIITKDVQKDSEFKIIE
jgi:hypothetical protein